MNVSGFKLNLNALLNPQPLEKHYLHSYVWESQLDEN